MIAGQLTQLSSELTNPSQCLPPSTFKLEKFLSYLTATPNPKKKKVMDTLAFLVALQAPQDGDKLDNHLLNQSVNNNLISVSKGVIKPRSRKTNLFQTCPITSYFSSFPQ
jgi:hypothetical protein